MLIVTQPVWRGRLDDKLRGFAPNPIKTKELNLFMSKQLQMFIKVYHLVKHNDNGLPKGH